VRGRAGRLREQLLAGGLSAESLALVDTVARAGSGALPVTEVPSVAVAVSSGGDAQARSEALRRGAPAVVCRVSEDRLLLDLRAVSDAEVGDLAAAVLAVIE